mgnify:CR=1 FL=1
MAARLLTAAHAKDTPLGRPDVTLMPSILMHHGTSWEAAQRIERKGAGRGPTANSCVSGILDIVQNSAATPFPKLPSEPLTFVNSYHSAFYVRVRFRDSLGIIKSVGEIFSECGVSSLECLAMERTACRGEPRFSDTGSAVRAHSSDLRRQCAV